MLRLLLYFKHFFLLQATLFAIFIYLIFTFPSQRFFILLISLPIFIILCLFILYFNLSILISKLCKKHYLSYEEDTLKNFLRNKISQSPLSTEASFHKKILLKLMKNSRKYFSELDMEERRRKLRKTSEQSQVAYSPLLERQRTLLQNLLYDLEVAYLKKQEFFDSLKSNKIKDDFYYKIISVCEKYDESSFHIDLAIMKPMKFYANEEELEFFMNLAWRSVLSLSKIGSHVTFSSYLENSHAILKWESDAVDFPEITLNLLDRLSSSIEKSGLELHDSLVKNQAQHINAIGILRLAAWQNSAKKMKIKTKIQQSHKGFSIKIMFQS